MPTFLKYFIYTIVLIFIGLYYLFNTSSGKQYIRDIASHKLSQKAGLAIILTSIDMDQYPKVVVEMNIEKKAKLTLTGSLTISSLDMDYKLISDCIATDVCKIDDNINIDGHVNGPYSRMTIKGEGKALDGNVTYHVLKYTDRVENLSIIMREINSTKLFTLMGYDELIKGKADIDRHYLSYHDT